MAYDFRTLRDSLYISLTESAFVPRIWVDAQKTFVDQIEQRFFPAGTSETVLTASKLERVFNHVVATHEGRSLGIEPRQLARQFESRRLHTFLAILITTKCDIEPLVSFTARLVAPSIWTDAHQTLATLPVERRDNLSFVLGDDVTADLFFKSQHDFFAPIIEKNKEVKGRYRRLPYVEEKLIGQGSFGKIYEVVVRIIPHCSLPLAVALRLFISPHHFKDGHGMSNNTGLRLARKDFELSAEDRAHEKERDVLREIVRNAKKHNNIMKSLGSLEIGSTYSLFMPLAECDLKQYMEKNPAPPETPSQKAQTVQSCVGLAGAIVYLHEELESPVYEKLSCFHMDLKPQNILVVHDPETGEQYWKLSDFNMSRVKMKPKPLDEPLSLRRSLTFNDNHLEINKLFKRRVPGIADASIADYTMNRRGWGTYLAPEACIDGYRVQAESDTWSLGCVISVVFSYLYGGQPAVTEFANLRSKNGLDTFFSFSGNNEPHKLSDAQLNDAVKRWHNQLRMETKKRNAGEGAIFDGMIKFLGQRVLVIDPKQRQQTKDIREQLITAFKAFRSMSGIGSISPRHPQSRFSMSRLRNPPWRRRSDVEVNQDWKMPFATDVRSCVFGPNAHPIVCVTDDTIYAYSLDHVLISEDTEDFHENLMTYGQITPRVRGRKWTQIGVTNQYIVAATDHHEFECYIYHISTPGNHNTRLELIHHWELKLPKIWKLAVSPDAQYVAFILCHNGARDATGLLYIMRLDDGQASNPENSNSSSPLGRPITLPSPAEDVCELRFSEVNGLYVVAKPRHSNSSTGNVMHVYAWSVQGTRHQGRDDLLHGLFTCFAPFNRDLAFVMLSEEKRVIVRAWNLQRYSQSNARGYRLLHILVDQDDQQILAFGTREAHNDLHLLSIPASNMREEINLRPGHKLPGLTYHSRFVAAINTTSASATTRRCVLIAALEGATIRLVRHPLDL
ncbi:kinase-like domain-containing protein [Paraphoma chrysanthemicola]|nr:kinase-like domain-containing protein [Paraphoma chrysanthemicola]